MHGHAGHTDVRYNPSEASLVLMHAGFVAWFMCAIAGTPQWW